MNMMLGSLKDAAPIESNRELRRMLREMRRRDRLAGILVKLWGVTLSVLGLAHHKPGPRIRFATLNGAFVEDRCMEAIAKRNGRAGLGAVLLADQNEEGHFYMNGDEIASHWEFGVVRVEVD